MARKKPYGREYIRFGFLAIALVVFFVGPGFVETSDTADIRDTIAVVKKAKMPKDVKAQVLGQLEKNLKFAKENANSVGTAMLKMPAVYWLALIIIALGLGGPLIMKYLEIRAQKANGGANAE